MWTITLKNWPPSFLSQVCKKHIEISSGGLVVVQGRNGVGKSTLLKSLASEADQAGIESFLLPQLANPQFPLALALGEVLNIYGGRENDPLLSSLDLSRSWKTSSGGERARILIAAALSQSSRLLLMDEPEQSLDPEARRQLNHRIQDWLSLDRERACVLVSHVDEGWVGYPRIRLEEES
jgi:ABC-type molybdenum transport system ATPase subunit/photorepair protein PhrA